MRLAIGIVAIGFLAAIPVTAAQPDTPAPVRTPLGEAAGKPYDLVANCLMKKISGQRFAAWPLVYAPPRQEALVNVWIRGRQYENPVATFHVMQDAGGTTRVTLDRMGGDGGPTPAAAEAAARQCLR